MEIKISFPSSLVWGAALAGLLLLAYLLWPVLSPFFIALLLAYWMNPLVLRAQGKKRGRTYAVVVLFTLFILLGILFFLLLVPVMWKQLASFIHNLPDYVAWLQGKLFPLAQSLFGFKPEDMPSSEIRKLLRQHWQEAGSVASSLFTGITSSTFSLMGWLANLLLVPVILFYLLRDWDGLLQKWRSLLPRSREAQVVGLLAEADEVLGGFLRGQLLVMLSLGVIYSVGLSLVGLEPALFLGMLAGLASIVPYLGVIVGISLSTVIAYIQFQEFLPVVYVLLVFGVGQVLESSFLTPMLVGNRIGLHPVGVIFAVLAGGHLAGLVGMLLALPVAAVVMVLLRHGLAWYRASHFYHGNH